MKTSSCKAKGRNFQKEVVERIEETFKDCFPSGNVFWRSMGAQGSDVYYSTLADYYMQHFRIECKCVEKLNIWEAFNQASENAIKEQGYPLLIFKRNRVKEPLACITLTDFMRLLRNSTPSLEK